MTEYRLPGYGSKSNGRCNTVVSADYCPDCHKTEAKHYHCKNWECPVCYPWAASRAAERVADRVFGCLVAWRSEGKKPGHVNHIVLSVPPSEYEGFDEAEKRRQAINYLKQIGVSGGAITFHPDRTKPELKVLIRQVMEASGMKGGTRDGIRANVLCLASCEDYTVFSPHFHVTGYFRIKEKSDAFFKRTGWTYKNVSMANRQRAEDRDAVRRTFSYLLTHHAVSKGKQSVVYFGDAANSKVSKKSYTEKVDKECPDCSSQMYKVAVDSEEKIEELQTGTLKVFIDQFSIKSRLRTIHNYYTVRPSKGMISTSCEEDPRLTAWKVAHGYPCVVK